LNFCGFLVFKNTLKPETIPTIEELREAQLMMKMVTGDNPSTAFAIAKNCGMVPSMRGMVSCEILEHDQIEVKKLFEGTETSTPEAIEIPMEEEATDKKLSLVEFLDSGVYHKNSSMAASLLESILYIMSKEERSFVFTGVTWDYMVNKAPSDARVEALLNTLVEKTVVFSRMQPDHKVQVIHRLQRNNHLVAMCGDGANDCGALKAADVGLSLSDAEASVSAPFTTRIANISSLETLLREGRCCLTTNFQCFKFIAMYSIIQCTSVIILFFHLGLFGNYQFLFQDLFLTTTLFCTLGMTGPAKKLTPHLPSVKVFSLEHMGSLFGELVIQLAGQMAAIFLLRQQSFYIPASKYIDPAERDTVIYSQETTVIFFFSSVLYIASFVAFNNSKPFKENWLKNYLLVISLFVVTAYTSLIFFYPDARLKAFKLREDINEDFLRMMFYIAIGFGTLMVLYQNVLLPCILRKRKTITGPANGPMAQAQNLK
jgi:cation-transporting ATPase 13A2